MHTENPLDLMPFLANLRSGLWLLGLSSWIFGILDRSFASFADGYISAIDIAQIATASFFFVSWMLLKPASAKLTSRSAE
ncbi:hypothetical protein [Leptolyngbya sp. FACHB-711]|uniref:hypothetical protein n=1 Tax=unclassified Leptolyngbya TaxID=2650499 RepID=UPI0016842426|nr:hypothetical protein [Leptolyngbya sp. FACHB-711]MBD1852276.1 hypothetical protein [Cyanobacteria bacterium FACHB-502]MBD2025516.1 hypothetical protein [Leptolyngbya sp. FACHB-711]